jgi:predicted extracellular nuclease
LPPGRRQTASARRQLFALATAAFILLQPALLASRQVAAQVAGRSIVAKPRLPSAPVQPRISVTTLGAPITQNFDTLPASGSATFTNDSTLPGWYTARTGTGTTIVANDGSSNAGNLYSYGAGTTTDRALGSLGSGNAAVGNLFWGVLLTNNSGSTITSLAVAYTGEQWRNSAAAAQTVAFSYITGTGTITGSLADFQSAGTNVTALDFTSPITGGTAGALNGNLAANRTAISSTISGLSLANGQQILLRWSDPDHTGSDHGLSIDDFSVTPNATAATPTPTPSTTPTLNIGDATQAEGNSGQTAFNFNVSLTSPAGAGGVTFNASTADGTTNPASAGSDYVAITNQPFTIPQGNSSTTVAVQVNGDTTPEPNETFFVNISGVTGATPGDVQGLGTITNDDVTLTPIHNIQGSGSTSPLVGTSVTTTGIVTGLRSNGFFLQQPDATADADPNTSEGVFVFTSSAPPAAAAIGNSVQVTATVQEFIPSQDLHSPPATELISPTTVLLSTGNPLPAPIEITPAETTQASETTNPLDSLEEYEGMRVHVGSLTSVAPTQGTIDEPNAGVTSNGVFYGVVTGVARPFREPGIPISDPVPAPAPANVPHFDENPERLRVDSDAQPGSTALNVTAGTVITNITGVLDFAFRTYTILPDAATPPTVGAGVSPTAVPVPTSNEFTVVSFNMERFFDTTDDAGTSDAVLTQTAFDNRVNKASLIIRNVQRYPDVIGVEEMENLSTLQAVAAKVNADAVSIDGLPNPNYQAYLVEGNDVGGIDVGFLVKASRVNVVDVTQVGKDTTYINPNNNQPELLNDRPPLVLRATINRPAPATGSVAFTVIVNHLRSLSSIDDPVDGNRVRTKRRAEAEFLANLIQSRQSADPTERIITVGDMNAFRVNDGYVDVIGTILGTPAPPDQVVLPSSDLVSPDQTDLVDTLTPNQQYSYSFDGAAQTLDHVIVNPPAHAILNRFAYARDDADQPVIDYANPAIPDRISDHDQPVAYFSLVAPQPQGSVIISEFRLDGPTDPNVVRPVTGGANAPVTNAPGTQENNNEFVEVYNNTDSDITVSTTDGSAGWALVASDGVQRFMVPNGTIIPARGHYLGVNDDGYTLVDYGGTSAGGGDNLYAVDIPSDGGVALFRTTNPANFTLAERLDAAGRTTAPALYREGAGLPANCTGNTGSEYSFVRSMTRTSGGLPKDTGDNASDFVFVSADGDTNMCPAVVLGAPGPENLSSPIQRNGQFTAALLDTSVSSTNPPNRTRDFAQDPANNSQFGTMSIRRTFTNNTGTDVTRLRFRIVEITTFPRLNGSTADLRARDSNDTNATVGGNSVVVHGTSVEQQPTQVTGGGWNTSMNVGFVNLGAPLTDGNSVSVQFLLGVMQTGTFRFFINIEADAPVSVVPPGAKPLTGGPTGVRK